jgi:drug/metabolite transporter (DMT)-like permease
MQRSSLNGAWLALGAAIGFGVVGGSILAKRWLNKD